MVSVYLDHGIREMMMRIGCFQLIPAFERGLRHPGLVRVGAAYGIVIVPKDPIWISGKLQFPLLTFLRVGNALQYCVTASHH
jgi:hypothetical protein